MEKGQICSHCGKMVDVLCADCWRCKNCPVDCKDHMKRTINGKIANHK